MSLPSWLLAVEVQSTPFTVLDLGDDGTLSLCFWLLAVEVQSVSFVVPDLGPGG